jgi:hypothetical protein
MAAMLVLRRRFSRGPGQENVGKNKGSEARHEGRTMKYHIHIYKVAGKMGIDMDAEIASIAKTKALKALKQIKNPSSLFGKSDCQYIAVAFRGSGGGLLGTAQRI